LVQIRDLTRRFGGVLACDRISLDVPAGELHAVIGPNGAGKSTLIGQLAGEIMPNAGSIVFEGRDITRLPPHRRSALGLARSFQITSLFLDFTVLDNVPLAVQAHVGHSFRLARRAKRSELRTGPLRWRASASKAAPMRFVPTSATASTPARDRHGVAIAAPLLLDEPMAGMGPDNPPAWSLLGELKREQTIVLIEHDMDAVFKLADRITVLVDGRVIASGAPDEIRPMPMCAGPILASRRRADIIARHC
jgi:branched-chain amino acid transport system ATP-binding protein